MLLDEPTNHLDLPAREGLEKALKDFDGTLIFVSHDRYFISAVAQSIAEIEGGTLNRYEGGYESYNETKKKAQSVQVTPKREPEKTSYRSKKERAEEENRKRLVKKLEEEISVLENEEAEINRQLSLPEIVCDYVLVNGLSKKLEGIKLQLDRLYNEYEKVI